MTDHKEALAALLAKVEADGNAIFIDVDVSHFTQSFINNAQGASNGSLDAAKALHEALIPGWDACTYLSGHAWVYVPRWGAPPEKEMRAENPIASRAWLLAIIKALIAECDA